jgi:3-oxosteroid 1-dehydrogenase
VGAGVGGMTASLVGSIEGLDVLLCEKSDMVGGTTSTSAGTIWIPGTVQSRRIGVPDSVEQAAAYLDSVIGPEVGLVQRQAFLASGPQIIDYLEERTDVVFAAAKQHPDYIANHPGGARGGRALAPPPFDGRNLGDDFARVRPPRSEFLVLGGMMVSKPDIEPLLHPFRSWRAFCHAAGLLLRHAADRLSHRRGTRLVMGNALVGRLLYSLRKRNVEILVESKLVELIKAGGAVVGAVIETPGGIEKIQARRGVVLATGGIGWNHALRSELLPEPAQRYSLSPRTNTGDGIEIARRAGAGLDRAHDSAAFWMPVSVLRDDRGNVSVWPHIIMDRAKPGLIAVTAAGRRFVNEANSYHDFVQGMLRSNDREPTIPAYLICDRSFIRDYGIGLVHPGTRDLEPFIKDGYLITAPTLDGLADSLKLDRETFLSTVAAHNRYAETGVDEEFGKGGNALNQFNGDPASTPNPCLRKIEKAPFFAVAVWPADLASSAGLSADSEARVLDGDGVAIPGLYACGNDMSSIMRGHYPGPGTTIGPAMVFAWRAVMHAADRKEILKDPGLWRQSSGNA